MRNKLLITVTLLATLISPAATVAEPDTLAKKTVADNVVVGNVNALAESKVGLTQDEMASAEIEKNLQKIEELRKAEEAKKAQKAQAVKAVTVSYVAVKATGSNADAIAYGRVRNAAVFGESHWSALYTLWSRESGWRDTALNRSSGACGIPQFISGCVLGDHVSQIDRGLIYIQKRYETPTAALAFWHANHWY